MSADKFSLEAMKEAFLNSLNEPWEHSPVIISPALYKRVEQAVEEGAVPPPFSCAADVVWWLGEWEKKKAKS